jgi:hypothetical protein
MSQGAIYIVTQDERYLNLLSASAESLKKAMPCLPITVFSQFPVEGPHFDDVRIVEAAGDGFYDKARLMLQSPYQHTIFVDADIHVVRPFSELFALLDRFDCAATHEEYLNTDWLNHYPRPDIPPSYPEFNTGILVYRRSSAMDRVFETWSALYKQFLDENPGKATNDQPFFRAAAYCGDARITTLGREYNCKFRGQGYLNGPVKLLHGQVKFKMKAEYMRRVVSVMNGSEKPRVYIGGKVYEQKISGRLWGRRKAHKVGSFPEPESVMLLRLRRLKELIKEQGVTKLLGKVIPWHNTRLARPPKS